jgi:hypothetical protein
MRTTLRTNCDRRKLELHRAGTNVPRRFWHKGDIATVPNHVRFRRECVELSLRQLMTRHSSIEAVPPITHYRFPDAARNVIAANSTYSILAQSWQLHSCDSDAWTKQKR